MKQYTIERREAERLANFDINKTSQTILGDIYEQIIDEDKTESEKEAIIKNSLYNLIAKISETNEIMVKYLRFFAVITVVCLLVSIITTIVLLK